MNTTLLNSIGLAVASLTIMGGAALADGPGEDLYTESCASCHGASGIGDGPMAEFMSVKVPDLTTIAQRNDGSFPTLTIAHIIDGRSGLRAHGTEMPIWGRQFSSNPDAMTGDYSAVYTARGQILSIVYYLESIQK